MSHDFDNEFLSKINMVTEIEGDFIPLLSEEDEEKINSEEIPTKISILPLKNNVLFPGMVLPISVSRPKAINMINKIKNENKKIGVLSQVDPSIQNPKQDDLHRIGTVAEIGKVLKMQDDTLLVILLGRKKFEVSEFVQKTPHFVANVNYLTDSTETDDNIDAILSNIADLAMQIVKKNNNIPNQVILALKNIDSKQFLINFIVSTFSFTFEEKQEMISETVFKLKAEKTLEILSTELQKLQLKNDIQSKVKNDLDQQQKEYFLQQQMKTIQEELGDINYEKEFEEYRLKSKKKKWSKEVAEVFDKELKKFQRLNPNAAEFSIQRNYIELLLDLPWGEHTKDHYDLIKTQKVLDKEHYGLKKVKERILEYLAVLKLKNNMKSPILCLHGPPGVGKTSLGKSIAKSLGRKYVRMSLGGLRDEAEIRGHRKTYIGAMPGRIIQNINKVKSSNPVFILDEIDKISSSYQGDPSSALLEVLDPEQNNSFYDNFLEMGYDLSKVFFIATANNIGSIPAPLLDRMELIEITGYTVEEKIEIVKKHLLQKQISENGLKKGDLNIDTKAIEKIIEDYTRESGVRNLEKTIAKVIRNTAKNIAMEKEHLSKVKTSDLEEILGASAVVHDTFKKMEKPGLSIGMAWTSVGGDTLYIESLLFRGKGTMSITGNLGNVMKESSTIALQYLKAHADKYNIDSKAFDKWDLHIHVPEGATPKDGPSAGITMFTALASLYTQRKLLPELAMSGEMTLRGDVLPVGGIKEKVLAAKRAGIKTIILSKQNIKDVKEIEPEYIKNVTFKYVQKAEEVIDIALEKKKIANPINFDSVDK